VTDTAIIPYQVSYEWCTYNANYKGDTDGALKMLTASHCTD
jgi:hypothetical protein